MKLRLAGLCRTASIWRWAIDAVVHESSPRADPGVNKPIAILPYPQCGQRVARVYLPGYSQKSE